MSLRPYRDIQRRKSRQIMVGKVAVGGEAPITVQSMTNTPTTDVAATVASLLGIDPPAQSEGRAIALDAR